MLEKKMYKRLNLSHIINDISAHKFIFFGLAILGMIFALIYTLNHKIINSQNFKINVTHPIYLDVRLPIPEINSKINSSKYEGEFPLLKFNHRTQEYTLISDNHNIQEEAKQIIVDAYSDNIKQLINIAKSISSAKNNFYFINKKNDSGSPLSWTNNDIAKINPDDVINSISYSFSSLKALHPNPPKYGILGFVGGLFFAFIVYFGLLIFRVFIKIN